VENDDEGLLGISRLNLDASRNVEGPLDDPENEYRKN
jgi:hypothetical protein